MKRTVISLITVLGLVAIAGLAVCSKATVEQEKIKVTRSDIVQSVSADGELSLPQHRQLGFGVNGKIDQVNVEEGAKVTKGQVLAKLETASLERTLKNAELGVKSAEVERQQAEAGVQSAKADLKQAELGIKTAEADLKQAGYGVTIAEADLKQAEVGIKTAQTDLDLATDNFRKITYPYTYSTFVFDVPQALDFINAAERQMAEARKGLQSGLTTDQYAQAVTQMQQALESLTKGRELLSRGQGQDVFQSGQLAVKDFWTLRAAQLAMDKARSGVEAANSTLTKAQLGVDTAKGVLNKAQLNTEVVKAALDKAQAAVRTAEGMLGKAQLAVDKARSDRDEAADALDKGIIKAPFDGIVAEANVKVGDILTPLDYTRTIFEIIDPQHMEFTIKVDEMDIPGVQLGQETTISIDALPNLKIKGKVIFISPLPRIDGGVVQYKVKIGFDVPNGTALKTGMSASASIVVSQHKNALVVPNRAVSQNKSGKPVVKLLVDGQLQERVVETGISNNLETEITSGLNEGDTIVIEKPAKSSSVFFGG